MHLLRFMGRVLARAAGAALLAVICSPLLLVGLVCLAALAVFWAIVFGLALGLAAVCALIFESLVGLPFWFWMTLTGTGAVLGAVGMLISVHVDGVRKPSSGEPEPQAGCHAPATRALWFLAGWLVGQRNGE